LTVHPDLIPEKRIKEFCDTAGIPLSTLRLYVEKISPALNDQYSKNVYLDQSIEEVYLLCETKI
jgi:DNA-binding transcriptional MerR regulator